MLVHLAANEVLDGRYHVVLSCPLGRSVSYVNVRARKDEHIYMKSGFRNTNQY